MTVHISSLLALLVAIIAGFSIFAFALGHPDLTQTQVAIECWEQELAAVAAGLLLVALETSR